MQDSKLMRRIMLWMLYCSVAVVAFYGTSSYAVVPQSYLKVVYPINYTIRSFNKVIDSGRYQGDDLAELYWERGVQYGDLHHYAEAIEDYTRCLELRPKFISAYLNRAVAHARLQQYKSAYADFAQALQLDPNNTSAYNTRGALNFLLGRYQDAVKDFKRYLKLRPHDSYRLLWLYMSEKNLHPDQPDDLINYIDGVNLKVWPGAIVRLYLGQVPVEDVINALSNNMRHWSNGNRCEAYFYLGQYFLLRGDRTNALRFFKQAVKTKATGFMEYEFAVAYSLKL
jgi:lipoprotein NlpI